MFMEVREMNIEHFLTTDDLIKKYGVTRQAIDYWRKTGLKHYQFGPRQILYISEEVEQYLKNKKNNKAKGE